MTTIELVIAISIISIITSICFMKLEYDNYKIDAFVRSLCSDIRYVRRENMLNNPNIYIRFVNENNKWSYILRKNKKDEKKVVLPKNVDLKYPIGKDCSQIKFNPSGTYINGGGTITINKDNKYKYITIEVASGRVLYKEGIYEK